MVYNETVLHCLLPTLTLQFMLPQVQVISVFEPRDALFSNPVFKFIVFTNTLPADIYLSYVNVIKEYLVLFVCF